MDDSISSLLSSSLSSLASPKKLYSMACYYNILLIVLIGGSVSAVRSGDHRREELVSSDVALLEDFKEARMKMNNLFETFEDLTTGQSVRVWEGIAKSDDVFNEKVFRLIEEAEDLDDSIQREIRKERRRRRRMERGSKRGSYDDDDDEREDKRRTKALSRMKDMAVSIVTHSSNILDDVTSSLGSTDEDKTLRNTLDALAEKAKDVAWALKSIEITRESILGLQQMDNKYLAGNTSTTLHKHKRKERRMDILEHEGEGMEGDFHDIMQRDDSATDRGVDTDPLSGIPVSFQSWRYSRERGGKRGERKNSRTNVSNSNSNSTSTAVASSASSSRRELRELTNDNTRRSSRDRTDNRSSPSATGRVINRAGGRWTNTRSRTSSTSTSSSSSRTTDDRIGRLERNSGLNYDITNLQRYIAGCDDCGGLVDNQQCPLSSDVLELRRWSAQLQNLLIYGCEKPKTCTKPGTCCLHRKYPIQQSISKMTQMVKELHALLDRECREECTDDTYQRDPAWMAWSAWSQCDVTCGQGVRERRRSCDNQYSNGRDCEEGDAVEAQPCRLSECCADRQWAGWSQWSTCSASCGRGAQDRSRRCDNPQGTRCGKTCPGQGRERRACVGQEKCCVDGNWAGWSRWASCSVSCGVGVTYRRRTCSNPSPDECGQKCPGRADERRRCGTRDCCVDGNWGGWATWTGCSVSCGQGTQSRVRRCDSPSPNFCGQRCTGNAQDTKPCGSGDCCVNGNWGNWGSWEGCSTTCGRGNEIRRRRCDSPPANSCGNACPGRPVDLRACQKTACCVNGNWAPWVAWSRCSASCGGGVRERTRTCSNPPPNSCGRTCPGKREEGERCNQNDCCVNGNWAPWAAWSRCSASCGGGIRVRKRTCSNPSPNSCGRTCPGKIEEGERCNQKDCCVNGNWAPWVAWSRCSASCGGGVRARTRTCSNPPPNSCGRTCPGKREEGDMCNQNECCVNGNWGQWARWTACSASCDSGFKQRTRACDDPTPNNCGRSCPGSGSQVSKCSTGKSCCVDGNWSPWARWSDCSVSCGNGVRQRLRSCDNPSPNQCGKKCQGQALQRTWCTGEPCVTTTTPHPSGSGVLGQGHCVDGEWGSWSPWTSCSATCGSGRRERERSCDEPPPHPSCGKQCPGLPFDSQACDSGIICCEDAVRWTNWSPWSSCSVTCDSGVHGRVRECQNLHPERCTNKCPGKNAEDKPCTTDKQCCIDGKWTPWSPWSGCSTSCGSGRKKRSRACKDPPPNHCGRPCAGRSDITDSCAMNPCPITTTPSNSGLGGLEQKRNCSEVQWSAWSPWSTCSETCDMGVKERVRDCDNPYPQSCDNTCPGQDTQEVVCQTGIQCCANVGWTSWSRWAPCSVTCGNGVRKRRRDCRNPNPSKCTTADFCRGKDTQTRNCRTNKKCCVDGNWSSWAPWSDCSATCGRGSKERRRLCDDPPANHCGLKCVGREYDTEICDASKPCPVPCVQREWSQWSTWSSCSTTCGSSVVERARICPPHNANTCSNSKCLGDDKDNKMIACGPEPVDGNWSPWNDWECRGPCSQVLRYKNRICDSPNANSCGRPCPGRAREVCDPSLCTKECAMRQWTTWENWSFCDKTCGQGGRRTRRMKCEFAGGLRGKKDCGRKSFEGCRGERVDDEPCGGLPMCIGDTIWGGWSACSVTCRGSGVEIRRMRVMTLSGLVDMSAGRTETKPCSVDRPECPLAWGPWGPCSASCRGQGVRERRTVVDLNDLGTIEANAVQIETQTCSVEQGPECPTWGPWGPCSATCLGEGVRQRTTTVRTDLADGGVIEAQGTQTETETCYASGPLCPAWGSWGPCSATCRGPGVRVRRIIGPVDNESKRPVETVPCTGSGPQCPVRVIEREWGEWGSCSATCRGQGVRERRTVVRTELAAGGFVEADAVTTERETCQVFGPRCPAGPTWATWEDWCPCGCSNGQRSRRRECLTEDTLGGQSKKVDISLCNGEARQEERCETRKVCPECIMNCRGRPDGKYPSCTGCKDYIVCRNGRPQNRRLRRCKGQKEWDGFIHKCVSPPSPSCSLKTCIDECNGQEDGYHHYCNGCSRYILCSQDRIVDDKSCPIRTEFNKFSGRCEVGMSPTCKRDESAVHGIRGGLSGGFIDEDGREQPSAVVIGDPWHRG